MKRMFLPFAGVLAFTCLFVTSCADKSSTDACQYETTMNLDKGDYDAVLQSACATPMHKGAAYLGKAGFTATGVINRYIDANATTNDLDLYMTSLIKVVTRATLLNLDNARTQYASIVIGSDHYRDAQFYLSIVETVRSLSLLKSSLDPDGSGTLTACDLNRNTHRDEADALACALLVSGTSPTSGICPGPLATFATYSATADITFSTATGTYRGLVVNMTTASPPTAACPAVYRKTLYSGPTATFSVVATTAGTCLASDGSNWPCPVPSSIDLVAAIESSINASLSALSTAISGSGTDVQQAVQDMRTQACGGDATCTAGELVLYLQSL